MTSHSPMTHTSVVQTPTHEIHRRLIAPANPVGVVIFAPLGATADGDLVAALAAHAIATASVSLATAPDDDLVHADDVFRLADRLSDTIDWIRADPALRDLPIGVFGARLSVPAALLVAARRPGELAAVVGASGVPGLAVRHLADLHAPTLFLVGSDDDAGLALHRAAIPSGTDSVTLATVAGGGADVTAAGLSAETARLAGDWFAAKFQVARQAVSRRGLGDDLC